MITLEDYGGPCELDCGEDCCWNCENSWFAKDKKNGVCTRLSQFIQRDWPVYTVCYKSDYERRTEPRKEYYENEWN